MSGKGAKGLSGKGLSGKGAKGTMSAKKGDKRKPTSRSVKAGLQFPVGRIHRFLKVRCMRLSRPSAISRSSGPTFESVILFDRLNSKTVKTQTALPPVMQ